MTKATSSLSGSVIFAYIVVYLVWGSTFFFIEKALHAFTPFVLGSIRFIIAGTLLMLYCKIKGYKLYLKEAVQDAALVGFLLLFVDMASIIWSEQYISSAIVTIISAAAAIWFVLLDRSKWKENFSNPFVVTGLIMGFVGVLMLFAEQLLGSGEDDPDSHMKLIAMLVMTLGTVGWTIGSLFSKYSKERRAAKHTSDEPVEDLNVMVKTAWQMVVAGVMFTLVAIFSGEYSAFEPKEVPTIYWGAVIYLALMGSILAFSSYIYLLQVRPATEVSTYAYVNPIVALLLAHFFTDHIVTPLQIIGLVVVLFSVLLMNWRVYSDSKFFRNYKRRRKIRKLRHMAPKSSIPRIVELMEYINKRRSNSQK